MVFQYFPKYKQISKQYDDNFFEERVRYYDAIFNVNANSFDEGIEKVIKAFESIIMYDYADEYVRFNENTPLMILDFFKQFEISMAVKMFYNALPNFFGELLTNVKSYYDDLSETNVRINYKDDSSYYRELAKEERGKREEENQKEKLTKEEEENIQFFHKHILPIIVFGVIILIAIIIGKFS